MNALSFALPFSGFLYMLGKPTISEISNVGKLSASASERSNNLLLDVPETYSFQQRNDDDEFDLRFLFPSLDPLTMTTTTTTTTTTPPTIRSANFEPRKLSFRSGFDAVKPESKHHRSSDSSTNNVQLLDSARGKWSQGTDERKASDEIALPVNGETTKWESKSVVKKILPVKNVPVSEQDVAFRRYGFSDIKDVTLKEKFGSKGNGVNVGAVTRTDAEKTAASVDNRANRKTSYIWLCKRFIGPTGSRRKECVKFPRSEFYVEHGFSMTKERRLLEGDQKDGLSLGTASNDAQNYREASENASYEYKQWEEGVKPH